MVFRRGRIAGRCRLADVVRLARPAESCSRRPGRDNRRSILAFPVAYYAFAGRGYAVFARYIVPIVPFVCLAAAWFAIYVASVGANGAATSKRRLLLGLLVALIAIPTARQSVLIDRLLATPDNRVLAATAISDEVPAGSVVCQTGAAYGRVPLALNERSRSFVECEYDPSTGRFTADAQWVLVQRSPLILYSAVPDDLERMLARAVRTGRQLSSGESSRSRPALRPTGCVLPSFERLRWHPASWAVVRPLSSPHELTGRSTLVPIRVK